MPIKSFDAIRRSMNHHLEGTRLGGMICRLTIVLRWEQRRRKGFKSDEGRKRMVEIGGGEAGITLCHS